MHICYLLAMFCAIPAGLSVTAIIASLITDESFLLPGFIAVTLIGGLSAYLLFRTGKRGEPDSTKRNYAAIAVGWLMAAILGAIPFLYSHHADETRYLQVLSDYDVPGAWFESISGFTSTGLTVASDSSKLPATIQWWRSLLQWVGGIGFVYIALFVLVPSAAGKKNYQESLDTELQSNLPNKLGRDGIMTIWAVYIGYTLAAIGAFWIAGMPVWEAINHGMTGISTGGFNITGQSFKVYNDNLQVIAIVVMLLGAISFGVHYAIWIKHQGAALFRDANARAFIVIVVIGSVLVAYFNHADISALGSVFNWVSALTNSGFSMSSLSDWLPSSVVVLILGMLIGGMTGATTGGIKVDRLRIVLRSWRYSLHDASPSHSGEDIDDEHSVELQYKALALVVLYLATWALGTLALILVTTGSYPPLDLAFHSASALANVGLSIVTTRDLGDTALFILSVLMWAGRLEIIAALALIASIWRRFMPAR